MPDYQLSKIYKLVSNKTEDIYIGSCLMRLSTRLSNHKNLSNTCASKKLFTNDAIITIVLLENYPCNTKNELKARELHYITTNNCININKPFVCDIPFSDIKAWHKEYRQANTEHRKEYYTINKEQLNEKQKEYYAINAEHKIEKQKIYNDMHKEQIEEYQKEYRISHRDQTNIQRRAPYAEKKLSQKLENTLNKNIIV